MEGGSKQRSIREILSFQTEDLPKIKLELIEKDIISAEALVETGEDIGSVLNQISLSCSDKALIHPQWSLLAGRILIEIIYLEVPKRFSEATAKMKPILDQQYYKFVTEHGEKLDEFIRRTNDFNFDIFAVSTLRKSYLAHLKVDDKSFLMETPQYMYLRVATFLHFPDFGRIEETYSSLSNGDIAHATPTLFNSGMRRPQLSSCFLASVEDSMGSITKAWHDQGIISMNSGGIGYDYNKLRHSEIGQHGFSRGIVPWLKITNEILKTVDQCFGPDTIVYSSTGPKKMSEITAGDKLITENGKFNKVSAVLQYNYAKGSSAKLHSFKIKHYIDSVVVASCHPMLAFKFKKGESYAKLEDRLNDGRITPEYIDISDLDDSYFVALPIPNVEKDNTRITEADCRMYGIMLGDGYVSKNRNEFKVYLNDGTKSKTAEFVESYLTNRNIHFWTSLDNNCRSYGWAPDPKIFPFARTSFYNGNDEKIMTPAMMMLPHKKIMQIVKGLMETDGAYRTGGEIQISQSSRFLIECLRFILLRVGIPTSGNVQDRRGEVSHLTRGDTITTKKITYNLRIPKTPEICALLDREDVSTKLSYFVYDNKIWSRVVENRVLSDEEIECQGIESIIDLEMEGDEESGKNYMTCIGQAHNGGKRKGSGAMYLRDWHVDVYEFIELRDEGPEDMRAKDLFLGLMISDLFMKRVEKDQMWSLFCPNKVKGMSVKWGADFEMTYIAAEQANLYSRQVRARDLWSHILKMQIKKGMPYILYMDACNRKSNQKHSGPITCSNLCTEILETTNENEIASCVLASVCLSRCVEYNSQIGRYYFNFDKLERLTRELVRNLNRVIDRNYYPTDIPEIKFSNMKHRPLGIGVQGLADAFALLDISWIIPNTEQTRPEPEDGFVTNPKAKKLNDQIFETIYFAAVKESIELAKVEGGPYPAFAGSPASQGLFQFDLWEEERFEKSLPDFYDPQTFEKKRKRLPVSSRKKSRYSDDQWEALRKEMMTCGMRNSLLTALMPTASSAHILGNAECFEPFAELVYTRTVLSGQFLIVNKHLVRDLEEIGLWNTQTVKTIVSSRGSLGQVQPLVESQKERLNFLKLKYATVFEIPQKVASELALDRAENIDQTQSLNCHIARPTKKKLTAYHFYMWKGGAKTGMYYLRQKALADPINFAIDSLSGGEATSVAEKKRKPNNIVCTDEICTSCNV